MAEVIKYVSIEGRVQIEYSKGVPGFPEWKIDPEPDEEVLIMKFLNPDFTVNTSLQPLFFYLTDSDGKPDPVKFRYVHLTAAFNELGFRRAQPTLKGVEPTLEEWDEIETVLKVDADMNPSGPPKPKM
jgi:hypothetical protein